MPDISKNLFQKLAKGSVIVFIGTIASLILGFISRIIIIRFTTQDEYGVYSLALTIATIGTTISSLGLQEGTTRFIAYFSGKNKSEKVQEIIISSILVSLVATIITTLIIITGSDAIAIHLFNKEQISPIIKILSVTIPLTVLSNILISIFRGYNKTYVRVYFNDISKPLLFILLLCIVITQRLAFIEMVHAYLASTLLICLIITLYFFNNFQYKINWKKITINNTTRELILYSLPLLVVSILLTVMSWTDTLMLGFFKTTEEVATYNSVFPLANLCSVVINSIGYLYVPVISKLYSNNNLEEIKKLNASSTKWCFILTVPIFTILFLYPNITLNFLYGARYAKASNVLRVLSFGFIMNSFFGLNYYTLLSIGKSKLLMDCSLVSAIINIILNLILIPPFGSLGAGIASAISFTLIEIYMTISLYKCQEMHPFTKIYLEFTGLIILIISLFYYLSSISTLTITIAIKYYILFLFIYMALIYYMGLLDEEEMSMLKELKLKFYKLLRVSSS